MMLVGEGDEVEAARLLAAFNAGPPAGRYGPSPHSGAGFRGFVPLPLERQESSTVAALLEKTQLSRPGTPTFCSGFQQGASGTVMAAPALPTAAGGDEKGTLDGVAGVSYGGGAQVAAPGSGTCFAAPRAPSGTADAAAGSGPARRDDWSAQHNRLGQAQQAGSVPGGAVMPGGSRVVTSGTAGHHGVLSQQRPPSFTGGGGGSQSRGRPVVVGEPGTPSTSQQFSAGAAAPPRNRSSSRAMQHHADDVHPILRLGWRPLCEVHCNGLVGDFLGGHDRDLYIRVTSGDYAGAPPVDVSQGGCVMTCSQFEKAAGRELSKKWKESIHVVGEGEGSKATLVSWLKRQAEASFGEGVVGSHVWVCWAADSDYYLGSIVSYSRDNGKHKVRYSDRFMEELHLPAEMLCFGESKPPTVPGAGSAPRSSAGAALVGVGANALPPPAPPGSASRATASAGGGRTHSANAGGAAGVAAPVGGGGGGGGGTGRKGGGNGGGPPNPVYHQGSGISVTSMYDESAGGQGGGGRERARDRKLRLRGDARHQGWPGSGTLGRGAGPLAAAAAAGAADEDEYKPSGGRSTGGSGAGRAALRRRCRPIAEGDEAEAAHEAGGGAAPGDGAAEEEVAAAAAPRSGGSGGGGGADDDTAGSQDDSASPTLVPPKRQRTGASSDAHRGAGGGAPQPGRALSHSSSLPASFQLQQQQQQRRMMPPLQRPVPGPSSATTIPGTATPPSGAGGPCGGGAVRLPPPPPAGFEETNVRAVSRWMNSVVLALDEPLRAALAQLLADQQQRAAGASGGPSGPLPAPLECRLSPSGRFQTLLVYARKSNCIHGYYEAMLTRYDAFRTQPRLLQRKMEEFVLAALYEDGQQHARELAYLAQERREPDQADVADQFGEP